MKNSGFSFGSLLGGMLVGSVLAMLFTPKSGPEMRNDIKNLVGDEVDKVKNKVREKADKLEEKIEEARCKCAETL